MATYFGISCVGSNRAPPQARILASGNPPAKLLSLGFVRILPDKSQFDVYNPH